MRWKKPAPPTAFSAHVCRSRTRIRRDPQEFVGHDSCLGPLATMPEEINEVVLRIGVRGKHKDHVARFGQELAPLILTGPPSVTGFAGGRPKPSDVIAYWPALIPKTAVTPQVIVEEN
jgi:hypothetical protein